MQNKMNIGAWIDKMLKNPQSRVMFLGLLLVIVLGGAYIAKQHYDLKSLSSSAKCYGYDCGPTAIIQGAVYGTDGPFLTDKITVQSGDKLNLYWAGNNVTHCKPDWESNVSSINGITTSQPITKNEKFGVTCYNGEKAVAKDTLHVMVKK